MNRPETDEKMGMTAPTAAILFAGILAGIGWYVPKWYVQTFFSSAATAARGTDEVPTASIKTGAGS